MGCLWVWPVGVSWGPLRTLQDICNGLSPSLKPPWLFALSPLRRRHNKGLHCVLCRSRVGSRTKTTLRTRTIVGTIVTRLRSSDTSAQILDTLLPLRWTRDYRLSFGSSPSYQTVASQDAGYRNRSALLALSRSFRQPLTVRQTSVVCKAYDCCRLRLPFATDCLLLDIRRSLPIVYRCYERHYYRRYTNITNV